MGHISGEIPPPRYITSSFLIQRLFSGCKRTYNNSKTNQTNEDSFSVKLSTMTPQTIGAEAGANPLITPISAIIFAGSIPLNISARIVLAKK